jgi:nicotinate dehydrogenase subunit A
VENLSTPYPSIGIPCQQSLLLFLRNDLGLNGPKYGCGLGQCGACTVLVDGRAARACVIPADGLPGRDVTTLEGLSAFGGNVGAGLGDSPAPPPVLHPVQQAFADTQAAQCGYCLNGMVMMTVALLAEVPRPSDTQIRQHLSHNLCRCGTHIEILRAVHRAVELVADRVADKISGHSAI